MSGPQPDGSFQLDQLVGAKVEAVILHGLVEVRFGSRREHSLQIESDFVITGCDGHQVAVGPVVFDAGRPPSGMDYLAGLWGAEISEAEASVAGDLSISFTDGRGLVVRHDENYEAWHLTGPEGALVSLPGGGLG